jgi:hypothetical protein
MLDKSGKWPRLQPTLEVFEAAREFDPGRVLEPMSGNYPFARKDDSP